MTLPQVLLMLASVVAGVSAATAGSVADGEPGRELRICVDPDNPPLSRNSMGAQPGIDVEIGQAIAARLHREPRLIWVDTTYGGRALRRSLLAGQCELFMGLPVDPAAQTSGTLATTLPYYSTGYRLVRAHARANQAGDLRQLRIAVERQSGAQMRLEGIGSHLVVYGSQREVLDAVTRGEADAGAVWLPDVDRLLEGRALAIDGSARAAPDRLLRWNMAIGMRREDADLRTSVDRVVGDLLAEGRVEAIFERYEMPFFPPFADR